MGSQESRAVGILETRGLFFRRRATNVGGFSRKVNSSVSFECRTFGEVEILRRIDPVRCGLSFLSRLLVRLRIIDVAFH